jgi:hypothetical protein
MGPSEGVWGALAASAKQPAGNATVCKKKTAKKTQKIRDFGNVEKKS